VIVSRSLSLDKAKIAMPLLLAALFYDLSTEKTVTISNNSERRERDLQELFRRAKKPVALFVDDAHDLHPKTLVALKRLIELVAEGGGQLSIVLVGASETQERPAPPEDGRDRRPRHGVRVRRVAGPAAQLHRLGVECVAQRCGGA
jgi:type II secretory pathway predicted ATPase ExeA